MKAGVSNASSERRARAGCSIEYATTKDLARFAWLSVGAAIVTIVLKFALPAAEQTPSKER
jgi:hypothetical protein